MAFDVVVPRLGWSMEQGTFAGWLKQEGDQVVAGDPLFQLEGDKALQDIESIDSGILRFAPDAPQVGQIVAVGTVIAKLVREGEVVQWTSVASPDSGTTSPRPSNETSSTTVSSTSASPQPAPPTISNAAVGGPAGPAARWTARQLGVRIEEVAGTGRKGRITSVDVRRQAEQHVASENYSGEPNGRQRVTPRAKRTARRLGVSLETIQGTGAGGRIRERDVLAQADLAAASLRSLPITSRRRIIADRMRQSRASTVPVTITTRFDATGLITLRSQFKQLGPVDEVPSFQDMIIKLAVIALNEHPLLAGRWTNEAILVPEEQGWDIGFAVDTEDGLLVPVLRDVRHASLRQIAISSRQLIDRARQGKLTVSDMSGGVFTVTNLGSFGIDAFTPVIRSPETSILGIGAIRQEVIVQDDGSFAARPIMTLSLTFDHCVVDGAPAARFLGTLVRKLENPSAALL